MERKAMPDQKEFLRKIIGNDESGKQGRKRHTSAGAGGQAFSLRADFKDGRKKRGTAWSHFSDYEWTDEGDRERLIVIFGTRILTIEGFNLLALVREIDEGKLKTFEELASAEARELQFNPDEEAVVVSVDVFPKFEDIVREIKGEDDEPGFARKVSR
jgi:hypothetical protein